MGSRIMHLIIANKVASLLRIQKKNEFLLGGIAADAARDKDTSHFYTGTLENFTRSIDYEAFIGKYDSMENSDYILGYYSHLISDELWLKGFYIPWLKNRIEASKDTLTLYHEDFKLLNGKLLENYGFKEELEDSLNEYYDICDTDEVKGNEVKKFTAYALEDMNYDEDTINNQLKVFSFEQIIGYIETSVEKSIFLIGQHKRY